MKGECVMPRGARLDAPGTLHQNLHCLKLSGVQCFWSMRLRPIGIHFGYLAEQVLERVRRGEDSVFSIDDVERRLGLED